MKTKSTDSKLISFVFRYGIAVLLVGASLAITLFIWTFVKSFASPLFLLAIVVASWIGGIRPGIFATVLSGIIIDYFFIMPEYQISGELDDILRLIIFTVEGYMLCWMVSWRTTATEEIKKSREELQALSLRQQSLIENERKRIALEIHDELGQSLTALKMSIHLLRKHLEKIENPKDFAESDKRLKDLLQLTDTTISSVRRISTELRPAILDDLGLVAAIEWQAREFQRLTGIPCKMSTNVENINLGSEFSTAVFRIFQETLTNIIRHAETKNVKVNLQKLKQKLILRVEDNGKGIQTVKKNGENSLGILGMRERARLIGGELQVLSGAETGTIVELTAPLD